MNNILNIVLEVLGITIPIFVVILIGYFIKRKGLINEAGVQSLNKIAYNLGLPTLILVSITKYKLSDIFNTRMITVIYITSAAYMLLIFLLINFTRMSDMSKGSLIVSAYRCNMAFVGFPIVLAAYGSLALAKASLIVAFLVPINIFLTVFIFKIYNRKESRFRVTKLLGELALDPLILSAVAGILLSYSGISIPSAVSSVLDILSSMAIGLALISIGASFRFVHLKSNIRPLVFVTFFKLIIMPASAFALAEFVFKMDAIDRNVIVIMFSMPLAVTAYIMAKQYRSDADLVSSSLITTTLLSSITISLWLLVFNLL